MEYDGSALGCAAACQSVCQLRKGKPGGACGQGQQGCRQYRRQQNKGHKPLPPEKQAVAVRCRRMKLFTVQIQVQSLQR